MMYNLDISNNFYNILYCIFYYIILINSIDQFIFKIPVLEVISHHGPSVKNRNSNVIGTKYLTQFNLRY